MTRKKELLIFFLLALLVTGVSGFVETNCYSILSDRPITPLYRQYREVPDNLKQCLGYPFAFVFRAKKWYFSPIKPEGIEKTVATHILSKGLFQSLVCWFAVFAIGWWLIKWLKDFRTSFSVGNLRKDKRILSLIVIYTSIAWLIRNTYIGVGFIKLIVYAFFIPVYGFGILAAPVGIVLALFTVSLPSLLVSTVVYFISGRNRSSAKTTFVVCDLITLIALIWSNYGQEILLR